MCSSDLPTLTRDARGVLTISDVHQGNSVDVTVNGVPTRPDANLTLFVPGKAEIIARQAASNGLSSEPVVLNVELLNPVERIILNANQVVADSFEPEEGEVANLVDGNVDTYWHTTWSLSEPDYPHSVTIDLGIEESVRRFRFLQRQNQVNGRLSQVKIETLTDGKWVALQELTLRNSTDWIEVNLSNPIRCREIRIVALNEVGGNKWEIGRAHV